MPHFKCVGCRTRLYSPASPADLVDLCPECGSLLAPVSDLAEIVGYRAIERHDAAPELRALAAAVALTKPNEYP